MMQFQIISMIVPIIFVFVFIIIIIQIIRGIKEVSYNRSQPKLTVSAKAVSKRTKISRRANDSNMNRAYTYYYVTFQFESNDRLELKMNGSEFGMIAEGDRGKLTFQGNKFYDFEREY
ncbi:MAG: DUF2500 domain-containing protein [Vallitalea sp.]|nr:DUF2500 domain-containing protein [Vallitalea sp.]